MQKSICEEKKRFLFQKLSYISLPFGLVRKEKKIKLGLPKNYSASQYVKRLPWISKEDPNFQNSIIDMVNNRFDLKKISLAANDYGKNIQKNINVVVSVEKFNQAGVRRALDQKNKRVFESLIPISVQRCKKKKNQYSKPNHWKFFKPSQCK